MQVYSIANQKGGVLKSVTALSLAILLSRMERRVLLIDFDPQSSISDTFCDDQEREAKAFYRVLQDTAGIRECIIHLSPTLHFIPNDLELERFPMKAIMTGDADQYIIMEKLDDIKDDYDLVILDCPPNQTYLNILALTASDIVIVPTHRSTWTAKGTTLILDSIQKIKTKKKSRVQIGRVILFPTKVHRKRRRIFSDHEFREFTERLKASFHDGFITVSDVTIPHDENACALEDVTRESVATISLDILKVYQKFIDKEGL